MNEKPHISGPAGSDESPDDLLDVLSRLSECAVPTDEESVGEAEAALAESEMTLPEQLRDVTAGRRGADRRVRVDVSLYPAQPDADIDATLRRAAREGGHITPEIEQRMRRDREQAQREMDEERGTDSPRT